MSLFYMSDQSIEDGIESQAFAEAAFLVISEVVQCHFFVV